MTDAEIIQQINEHLVADKAMSISYMREGLEICLIELGRLQKESDENYQFGQTHMRRADALSLELTAAKNEVQLLREGSYKALATGLPKLSRKQAEAFDFIINYVSQHGYSPSTRELQEGLGYKSSSTPYELVDRLEAKGYIKRVGGNGMSRNIQIIGKRECEDD